MGYMEYECPTGQPYYDLMKLLQGKNYHIMTTNQDFQFTRVVPEEKLSAIQGDSRYYQCSRRCHDQIYDNRETVYAMNEAIDENLCIPSEMIPRCPKCGAEMEPWVRGYTFLELGVGRMTPMFIQEPFWNLTYSLPQAFYITVNPKDALLPGEIEKKGLAIREDIAVVLRDAVLIGASNGLSIAEGYHIFADNLWFRNNFGDFRNRYGIRNVLQGMFFQYPSEETKWAFFSRLISRKCYLEKPGSVMQNLYQLVGSKDYFVVTSNGEDHFVPAGFERDKVFEIEGRLTQSRCQNGCGAAVYENRDEILKMADNDSFFRTEQF